MVVDQNVAREYLQCHMTPGVWYRQNQLHDLFESVYDKWEPIDDIPLESEPNRERWRRIVGNCLRMSSDYGSFSDNSWVELRARRINPDSNKSPFEYSIQPDNPHEAEIVRLLIEQGCEDDGSGHVYAIINNRFENWIKIGMSIDFEQRLASYQTYSPYQNYEELNKVAFSDRRAAEKAAHRLAENLSQVERSGEWFYLTESDVNEIIHELDRMFRKGD